MDSLLAQQFRLLLREEHEKRMSDEQGSRRGVDIGNLLAGLVPGTMSSGSGGGAAVGDGRASSRLSAGTGGNNVDGTGNQGTATPPFSGTNGSYYAQQALGAYPPPSSLSQSNQNSSEASYPSTPTSTQQQSIPPPPLPQLSSSYQRPSSSAAIQHPHQRHLWDPARTGYGNGICFYDLALLHGRNGDDHGPCMCDLTACRTCFHELLYFRGRREVVPPPMPPPSAMMDGLTGVSTNVNGMGMSTSMPPPPPSVDVPHDAQLVQGTVVQAGAGPEPSEYPTSHHNGAGGHMQDYHGIDGVDEDDAEFNGEYELDDGQQDMYNAVQNGMDQQQQQQQHYQSMGYQQQQQQEYAQTSSAPYAHVQYTSQPSAGPKRPSPLQIRHPEMSDILLVEEHLRTRLHYMASPDVILRYGDEEEFIPPEELVMPPSPPIQDTSLPTPEQVQPLPPPKQQVKVIQGRKMKGGKIRGGQQKLTVAMKTVPPPPPVPAAPVEKTLQQKEREKQQKEVRTRLNGSQLPKSWTDESASSRNMAVILTFRHLVKVGFEYYPIFRFRGLSPSSRLSFFMQQHPISRPLTSTITQMIQPFLQKYILWPSTVA